MHSMGGAAECGELSREGVWCVLQSVKVAEWQCNTKANLWECK